MRLTLKMLEAMDEACRNALLLYERAVEPLHGLNPAQEQRVDELRQARAWIAAECSRRITKNKKYKQAYGGKVTP